MLKALIQKILRFFSVAQTEREIEVVKGGACEGGVVYRIHGREVFVPDFSKKENGLTVYVTDLSEAYYCKFSFDPNDRSGGHLQPHKKIERVSGQLSEEDHDVLVKMHEHFAKEDEEKAAQGNPVSFKRELIRLYPPRPTGDAGSHPQVKSDVQPR